MDDKKQMEMEIVESENSIEELNEMMFNLAHYVIAFMFHLMILFIKQCI